MAITFDTFADGKRYRLIFTGSNAIKTEDGVREPYQPFDASPRWLRGHHGLTHRLVATEDYALGLAKASLSDLREHARRRSCGECGHTKGETLTCLLEGIAPVPDFVEEEPKGFVSTTLHLDALSRNDLRDLASEQGLPVGGTKDELRARIEDALREPFEEEE